MRAVVPYGETDPNSVGLAYLGVEISWGSRWVNLNDGLAYQIGAETRDSTAKTWRKTLAQSPILGGSYLVHAVPEMVTEQIQVRVFGDDQTDLNDNLATLDTLFEQLDYRIRWTLNEYREYWRCQLAEATWSRGQVWTHNQMAVVSYAIPRFPNVEKERV